MNKDSILHRFKEVLENDSVVEACKEAGNRARAKFLGSKQLQPPEQMRLIDCKMTCEENEVVIVDWREELEYSAISHTFGMEVYGVFDCECITKSLTTVARRRCSGLPCPTHAVRSPRNRVGKDILNMCATLYAAGVNYIWHDGVCIAQHDREEVKETTKHMGWIYAKAKETIIFLHYVGKPMAPIRHDGDLISRWQTRVWTLQEGAVSRCRRYCIRVGEDLTGCQNFTEFEQRLAGWYNDDTSKIAVVEEDEYWKIVKQFYTAILWICHDLPNDPVIRKKIWRWIHCINTWVSTLVYTCFEFPTIQTALEFCSERNSKHVGDRINSILALAGLTDFVAEKDKNMEASTIEFFKRGGQQGLARAVFTINVKLSKTITPDDINYTHTWVPILAKPLASIYESAVNIYTQDAHKSCVENVIGFTVLLDNNMELNGQLACFPVKFTLRMPKAGAVINVQEQLKQSMTTQDDDISESNSHDPAVLIMDLMFDMNSHGFSSSLDMNMLGLCSDHLQTWASHNKTPCIVPRDCKTKYFQPGPSVLELHNAIKDQLLSHKAVIPAASYRLELGRAIVPRLSVGDLGGPVVQGHEIQDDESFSAHLVFPLRALEGHIEFSARYPYSQIPEWDWSMPGLLVQGDLFSSTAAAPVYKLGCFHLNKQIKCIFARLLPSLTVIPKLVIQ